MGRDNSGQEEKIRNILDATLEVISRETISGTRMHLIAREAGVSQSILHYYFSSKNDILVQLMQALQKEFNIRRTQNIDARNKPLEENLQGFLQQKQEIIEDRLKLDIAQFDFFVQSLADAELRETFRKFFQVWYDEIRDVIRLSDLPPETRERMQETAPRLLISLMMGASMQYLIWDGEDFDLDRYFQSAGEMLLGYLRGGG